MRLPAVLAIALVLAPLAVIGASWFSDQGAVWQHLRDHQLASLIGNTALLLVGVGVGVTLLGVSLAWLMALHEFPGRRWLEWALVMPLAMPAYVLAFTALGALGPGGVAQRGLAAWLGEDFRALDVRSGLLLVAVLSGAFYPYVYLLVRNALLWQGRCLRETARTLGAGPWRTFWRVSLPHARPAVAAGVSLAVMETLADYGAVATFNYDTLVTAVYQTWFGLFSPLAAAQLSSLLALFAAGLLCCERWSRGRAQHVQSDPNQRVERVVLAGARAWLASGAAFAVLLVFFVLPTAQLLSWAALEWRVTEDWTPYIGMLARSATLGGVAALATVALVSAAMLARRAARGGWSQHGVAVLGVGYAMPGVVLAVGMMLVLGSLSELLDGSALSPLLRNGLLALLLAYVARFAALAIGPLDASWLRLDPALIDAARSLGASQARIARRVALPLLAPGAMMAGLLVFVEVVKEMPATLLLRPFGWDTLALRVFEMTAEGHWRAAALPSLLLLALGLLPVAFGVGAARHIGHAPAP